MNVPVGVHSQDKEAITWGFRRFSPGARRGRSLHLLTNLG
jgi:hypothetical protein